MPGVCKRYEAYHWTMSGTCSACAESDRPDRAGAADFVLRQEPDEEEEDEGDGKEDENDDEEDGGYSERSPETVGALF